ncbi:GDSL esterase/lipase, partial [Trifolium pratense]
WYERGKGEELVGWSDSDYAGDVDDRRSTSGYVFMIGTKAVSWSSKKQPIVTLSTTEAEFIAATSSACQGIWLSRILTQIDAREKGCITIYCDNNSSIKLSKNPVMHGRSKHIDVRFHFLRDLTKEGQFGLQVEAGHHIHHRSKKLFIFGDSYADTGNTRKGKPGSWKEPYGMTSPGKPTGRFSDGRVLTDFIAKYLGLRTPITHKLWDYTIVPKHYLKYGMNFAYGGTVAGNDYNHYLATNGSLQGFPSFIASVVKQTTTNLIQLQSLGFKRIVVGGLQPLGCLPQATAQTSFQSCNSTFNDLVTLHNNLLNQSVTKLNLESNDRNTFTILDIFDGFKS